MSLLAELKRRKVFKVAAAYVVVGWLVVQIAATVAPQLNLPEWAPRLITFVVLLGFPVALVLAWVLDVTPEGLRIEAAPIGNKRMFAIAAVLGLLAVGWYWKGRPAFQGDGSEARSIAVLPFVNMSGDPDNEYFSDGISEEILNVLARTPELKVAARTSSFAFKGQQKEIPEIARALEVRMVLEGSVRRQEDRVRITAQLIDAKQGFHLWSQTYDRELKDIFAIQDEIARAIGEELKVKIVGAGEKGPSTSGTENLEAHDFYLQGLALWQLRREQELFNAIALFERAVKSDPGFAPAYAGAALVYVVLPDYTTRISDEEAYERGRDSAERALALDPLLPEPYAALGSLANVELRRASAAALFRRAIALRPSFATAHQWLGTSLMAGGDPQAGLASLERAVALDPRSLVVANNHATVLLTLGRYAEATASCARVLEFAPNYVDCASVVAFGTLLLGKAEAARPMFERWAALNRANASVQVAELFTALAGQGDRRAFAQRLAGFSARAYLEPGSGNLFSNFETPGLLVMLGENQLALEYLERISSGRYGGPEWPMMLPVLDPIRCDPRFTALIQRLKTTDPRAPAVCAKKD